MAQRKGFLSVNQVIDLLEDDIEFEKADIFIEPPNVNELTDEESGDDEGLAGIDNLSGRQLCSGGAATIYNFRHGRRLLNKTDLPESTSVDVMYRPSTSSGSCGVKRPRVNSSSGSSDESDETSTRGTSTDSSIEDTDSDADITEDTYRSDIHVAHSKPRTWVKEDLKNENRFQWKEVTNDSLPTDVIELFELFFDTDVITMLCNESKRYAGQKGNHAFDIDNNDLQTFFAILLVSGYNGVPRRRQFWSEELDVRNEALASAMARDRFDDIMRYFHIQNNDNLDLNDKMCKVRPLIQSLNKHFLKYFRHEQNLSVDESMVPYFGKHGAKQFIRGKPIRFGFKMWVLASTLGYIVQLEPYQGASLQSKPGLGMGGNVVVDLVLVLDNNAYHITFDNLFSSLSLVDTLTKEGFACTGTIRANRIGDCPLQGIKVIEKQPRGTFDYRSDSANGLIIIRWNDNNVVNVISNKSGISPIQKASRWSKSDKKRIELDQPFAIRHYNKTMGGVDRLDQNIHNYRISFRSKKWWWSIFAFCLDICVQQVWHLYRSLPIYQTKPKDLLCIRREIAKVYLMRSISTRKVGRPLMFKHSAIDKRVPQSVRFDRRDHYIEVLSKQLRCAECGMKTRHRCIKCQVGVHDRCFVAFHVGYIL